MGGVEPAPIKYGPGLLPSALYPHALFQLLSAVVIETSHDKCNNLLQTAENLNSAEEKNLLNIYLFHRSELSAFMHAGLARLHAEKKNKDRAYL